MVSRPVPSGWDGVGNGSEYAIHEAILMYISKNPASLLLCFHSLA